MVKPNINDGTVKQQVFGAEFLASLIFFISWIVVRQTQLTTGKGSLADQYMSLFRPLMIAISWLSARIIFIDLMGASICNPTLVFGSWIFDLLVYNDLTFKKYPDRDPVSVYTINKMSEWIWIYFFASMMAALFAGYIAK